VSPDGFKMTLHGDATAGWTLTDHGSGQIRHFDPSGRLTAIEDRNDNQATFGYSSAGALTAITTDVGPAAPRTLEVATSSGRISELTQLGTLIDYTGYPVSHNRSVEFFYDGSGRLETIVDPEGRQTGFAYSGGGNLASVTAPGGAVTSFGYDGLGRVTTVN
jgi:YD repeat-containing protein